MFFICGIYFLFFVFFLLRKNKFRSVSDEGSELLNKLHFNRIFFIQLKNAAMIGEYPDWAALIFVCVLKSFVFILSHFTFPSEC